MNREGQSEKGTFGQRLGTGVLGQVQAHQSWGPEKRGAAGLAVLVGAGWSVCPDLRSADGLKPRRAGRLSGRGGREEASEVIWDILPGHFLSRWLAAVFELKK